MTLNCEASMAEWSKATGLSPVSLRRAQVRTLLDAYALVAQLVSASCLYREGWGFESLQEYLYSIFL